MTPTSRVQLNASPFSMFFQSLSPNFNIQEGGQNAAALNNYIRARQEGQNNQADAAADAAAAGEDGLFHLCLIKN